MVYDGIPLGLELLAVAFVFLFLVTVLAVFALCAVSFSQNSVLAIVMLFLFFLGFVASSFFSMIGFRIALS